MIPVWVGVASAAGPGEAGDWCSAQVSVARFEEAVARAELGIHTLDAEAVTRGLEEADLALPCLDGVVGVDPLARYYRASAVQRLVSGDEGASIALFRGARALQPAYKLDPSLAPPIQGAWAAAEPDPRTQPLPLAASGTWVIDARPGAGAPLDRPFVVQWVGEDGGVRATALLEPGEPVPFGTRAAPAPVPLPAPTVAVAAPPPMPAPLEPRKGHPSRVLAISALGSAVVAGAGIAAASALQEEVLSSPHPSDELSGLVVANRIVGYGAGGVAIAAVGLGASAIVVGRW